MRSIAVVLALAGCTRASLPPVPDAARIDAAISVDAARESDASVVDARVVLDAGGRDAGWPRVIGAPCTEAQSCGGGGCYERVEVTSASGEIRGKVELPGGYCSSSCDASEGSCPPGAVCASVPLYEHAPEGGLTLTSLSILLCAPSCTDVSECRASYRCESGACVPPPPTR